MTQFMADGSTLRSLTGLNASVRPFARASASLLAVRGAHWTDALMDSFFMKTANSIIKALEGNFVVMSLLSADPFPRLSVQVGATWTRVRCSRGPLHTKTLKAISTARASRVEMTNALTIIRAYADHFHSLDRTLGLCCTGGCHPSQRHVHDCSLALRLSHSISPGGFFTGSPECISDSRVYPCSSSFPTTS